MRVAQDPDFAAWLSPAEAKIFCEDRLGLGVETPHVEALRALTRAFLGRIPFHNILMLARYGRAPTRDEILDDMRRGRGGPCNAMNPFFAALLLRLGYDVALVSGTMQQPDCHIALWIELEGRAFWLDVGNGHPYLEPIPLGDEAPRTFAGLSFRLVSRGGGTFAIEHVSPETGLWTTNYTFSLRPRALGFFDSMIEEHHTKPGFGPFLTGLRLIRFPGGALTAIRDEMLLEGQTTIRKTRLADRRALGEALAAHFGDLDLPIDEALASLRRAGHPLYEGAAT